MHKIWMMFEPRQALIGLHVFLAALALMIHFLLLSTDKYNWLDGPATGAETAQNMPLPE